MNVKEDYIIQLLESIFDVSVHFIEHPSNFFSDYHLELRRILLKNPQPSTTELQKGILVMPINKIFYLKSALGYINIFFRLPEPNDFKMLCIGPFLEEDFSKKHLIYILREGGLTSDQSKWLRFYFSSLPTISQSKILRILSLVLTQEIPGFLEKEIIFRNFQPLKPRELRKFIDHEEQFAKEYQNKFLCIHQDFFRALQLGDFKTIFIILPQYLSEFQFTNKTTLYSYKRMLHDLNAQCRLTLFATHIPPYNIYQTWYRCSEKINLEMRQERMNNLAEWMMKEYALLYKSFGYKSYSPIIRNVIEYIHQNLHYPISLQEIADQFGRNKSTLSRQFKEEVGENFSRYTQRIKIESSLEKIIQGQESIQDIALSVGFDNQAYFNRVFHKFMDVSPTEYRLNWYSINE